MANAFDQFDTSETMNPFDKFDPTPPQPRSFMQNVGRDFGLSGRYDLEGALTLPAAIADVPVGIYNAGANLIQGKGNGYRFPEQNQALSGVLDKLGFPQPETQGERLVGDVSRGVAGAGAGTGLATALQGASSPIVASAARALAANPAKQAISGGLGGGAAGSAREAGLPPIVQMGAGLAAGAAPFAPEAVSGLAAGGGLSAPETRAMGNGFVLPPSTMESPSLLSKLLGGWSGKVKSQQGASVKNQVLTKQIAAGSLGLPRDTVLDDNVFQNLRQKAGTAYEDVKQAIPTTVVDPTFVQRVSGLGSLNSDVVAHFPELVRNDDITNLATSLAGKTDFPTSAGVEAVKILRANGTKNLQAIGAPEKHALGFAQRDAADAIDDLLDRNISASGQPGLVDKYRAARQLIAKSHDVESATNTSTGEVDPRRLALLADKGKPLSGGLETIADTANAFPKAMQMPSKFGGSEPLSVLDILSAAGAAGTGHAGLGAAILGRPLARSLTLSDLYQNAIQNGGTAAPMGAAGLARAQLQPMLASILSGQNQ